MTSRERRLLYAFCALILVAVTWFVLDWRGSEVKGARFAKTEAETQLQSARLRIDVTKADLEARRGWLESRQIEQLTMADASSQLLNRAQRAASMGGLSIESEKFLNQIDGKEFDQARMSGRLIGSEQAVYSALVAFHDPDRLQVIREMRIQPDKKTKGQIIATVEFRLYYRPIAANQVEPEITPAPESIPVAADASTEGN